MITFPASATFVCLHLISDDPVDEQEKRTSNGNVKSSDAEHGSALSLNIRTIHAQGGEEVPSDSLIQISMLQIWLMDDSNCSQYLKQRAAWMLWRSLIACPPRAHAYCNPQIPELGRFCQPPLEAPCPRSGLLASSNM